MTGAPSGTAADRVALLDACAAATHACAPDAVRAGCEAKGLAFDGPDSAEEWPGGPVAIGPASAGRQRRRVIPQRPAPQAQSPEPISLPLTAALQLHDPVTATMVATFRAWNAISLSVQRPGTTIAGVTQPGSLLTRLETTGVAAARLRACPSGVAPQTMASCTAAEPVRRISSTPVWCTRYEPTSAPPQPTRRSHLRRAA